METARFDEFSHSEIIAKELSDIFYDVSIACRRLNVSVLKYLSSSPAFEEDERGWTSARDCHGFDPIWSSDTAVALHHLVQRTMAIKHVVTVTTLAIPFWQYLFMSFDAVANTNIRRRTE